MAGIAPRLYVIGDRGVCDSDAAWRAMLVRVADALTGRPQVALQVRHKLDPAPRAQEHGRGALQVLRDAIGTGLRVLWNTPDGTPCAGFAGVHLTESALKTTAIADQPLVSASVHSPDSLRAAVQAGADFVVFGPVFDPGSKPGVAGVGLQALEEIVHLSPVPVLALGGVTPDRVAACRAAGAWGVACVTPIVLNPNPSWVVGRYLDALDPSTPAKE